MQSNIPFHPEDQVRQTKFKALYHWAMSIGKYQRDAFFLAKYATLKQYPIIPWETFYPVSK